MSYTKEEYLNRVDWLSYRGIGGSSASAILGVNPYMTKGQLYEDIVYKKEPSKIAIKEKMKTESQKYGQVLEPHLRDIFKADYYRLYMVYDPFVRKGGRAVKGSEIMYRRDDKPYLTATLDGTLLDKKTQEQGIFEAKTRDIRKEGDIEEWDGHLPMNYYVQVLHYLNVKDDTTFAVLFAKLRFFQKDADTEEFVVARSELRPYWIYKKDSRVQRDMAILEKAETDFWENNVQKKVYPYEVLSEISLSR